MANLFGSSQAIMGFWTIDRREPKIRVIVALVKWAWFTLYLLSLIRAAPTRQYRASSPLALVAM